MNCRNLEGKIIAQSGESPFRNGLSGARFEFSTLAEASNLKSGNPLLTNLGISAKIVQTFAQTDL
jgi:hypothetical protein